MSRVFKLFYIITILIVVCALYLFFTKIELKDVANANSIEQNPLIDLEIQTLAKDITNGHNDNSLKAYAIYKYVKESFRLSEETAGSLSNLIKFKKGSSCELAELSEALLKSAGIKSKIVILNNRKYSSACNIDVEGFKKIVAEDLGRISVFEDRVRAAEGTAWVSDPGFDPNGELVGVEIDSDAPFDFFVYKSLSEVGSKDFFKECSDFYVKKFYKKCFLKGDNVMVVSSYYSDLLFNIKVYRMDYNVDNILVMDVEGEHCILFDF